MKIILFKDTFLELTTATFACDHLRQIWHKSNIDIVLVRRSVEPEKSNLSLKKVLILTM